MGKKRIKKKQINQKFGYCKLCGCSDIPIRHHTLVPSKILKTKHKHLYTGKRQILCIQCHDYIHELYDERTLAFKFDTLEKMQKDKRILEYVYWKNEMYYRKLLIKDYNSE